jgi:hypothetical protein
MRLPIHTANTVKNRKDGRLVSPSFLTLGKTVFPEVDKNHAGGAGGALRPGCRQTPPQVVP